MKLTQKQFVRDCYDFYKREGLEPGNPFHGDWQQAHYPKPKKFGRRWVWLLKEHHAIQSVLQSEEVGHPAVWSWERKYFVGEWAYLLPAFEKWMSEKGRIAGRASVASLTAEELAEKCRKAGSAPHSPLKEGHRRGSAPASEKQKKVAREVCLLQREKIFKCLKTGYITDFKALNKFQKHRGIDFSQREELSAEEAEKHIPRTLEEAKILRRRRRKQREKIDKHLK